MALVDQLLYGTYVGLVVDVDDPDVLGRAKILVPGKNGLLFTNWNNLEDDINFYSVTPDFFSEDVLSRLKKVLPWARPAMPIWGGGTGSFNSTSNGSPNTVPTSTAFNNGDMNPAGTPYGTYYEGDIGPGGTHFHIDAGNARQGSSFDRNYLDQYVLVNGNPISSITTVNGGEFGASRTSGTHTGWDYAVGGGQLTLTNGAVWSRPPTRNTGVGDIAYFKIPGDSREFRILHGKFQAGVGGSTGSTGPTLGGSLDNRQVYSRGENRTDGVPEGNSYSPTCQAVDPTEQYNKILQIIKDKQTYNQGAAPAGGDRFGVNSGTPEAWAGFYTKVAGFESGGDPCLGFKDSIEGVVEPGGSGGLYQLGRDQIEIWSSKYPDLARSYGIEPGRNYSESELLNADLSTRGMLFIGDALLRQNYAVLPGQGIGRTIGYEWKGYPSTLKKIELGRSPSWKSGATTPPQLVQRTTNQGVNAHNNINVGRPGQPIGSFSIPAVGAKVYVMFEGGSPQRPIYFAMAYDPSNIQSNT